MNKKIILTIALNVIILLGYSQTKKALFLGNSYTAYNNLPQLVNNIALSNDDQLIYDSNTPGGYTFEGHSTNATTLEKIQEGDWDFVVLQEQSQIPSFPISQVEADCFPYAEDLVETIRTYNECAMPLFYMTWGRKDGDANNCEFWPPVCTYEGMQELLTERYTQMGFDNDAYIGPVGEAWKMTRENYPDIELYASDGSHPSYAGSYLAACVFYSSMWGETVSGTTYSGDLDDETASQLQEMADEAVFGGVDWNHYDLLAFDLTLAEGDVMHFLHADLSPYISYLEITFEGETYTLADDEEAIFYVTDNESIAEIVVVSPCGTNTLNIPLSDLYVGISEIYEETNFSIFPNPTSELLNLSSDMTIESIQILDMSGRIVFDKNYISKSVQLDLGYLEAGVYYVLVNNLKPKSFIIR